MKIRSLFAIAAFGAATLAGSSMIPSSAAAMPVDNLANAVPTNVDEVRMVCGWRRCWWVPGPRFGFRSHFYGHPGFRSYGFYGRHHRRW